MKKAKFFLGTSGWNYPDWKGVFYPDDLPANQWLHYYAKKFSVVELNATTYRFFPEKNYINWREQVPKNFKFMVKVHRLITHRKYLKDCDDLIKRFCESVKPLENKLKLILLQLPPTMPYDPPRLKKALLSFDNPTQVVVEFRHPRWLTEEVKEMLTELGCIFCAIDSPTIPLTDWVTSDIAYIRLHGRKKWYDYDYTKKEIKEIAAFAKSLTKKGAKEIYIFFNNDYYGYALENAIELSTLL